METTRGYLKPSGRTPIAPPACPGRQQERDLGSTKTTQQSPPAYPGGGKLPPKEGVKSTLVFPAFPACPGSAGMPATMRCKPDSHFSPAFPGESGVSGKRARAKSFLLPNP
eukprot:3162396-Amphidinium_carterae.2